MKRRRRRNFIYVNCASKIYVDFISRVENLVKFRIALEDKILFEISYPQEQAKFYVKFKSIRAGKILN